MEMTPQKELSPVSETLLLERCRQGDRSAYGQIVERYQTLVCSVAYNRCGDFALSEDLAQEAFLAAWEKLADLRDASRFKAWVCSIVRSLTTRTAKRRSRSVTANAAQLDAATELSAAATPDEQAVSNEEGQLVWQALEVIPEKYREPMILFYREEQSVARVAEALELSHDAVKQRLSRGRRMLQQEIAATIEKALKKSTPSTAFTVAVLAGLSGTMSNTAAAGASTAAAAFAKSGGAGLVKSGVGGLLGIPILALLAQLPVMRWLIRTSLDQTRSEREHRLLKRFYAINGCVLIVFTSAAFSSIWWKKFLGDSILTRVLLIPGLMVLTYIPLFWTTYRMGRQVKQLREEEGTATPVRPLCEVGEPAAWLSKSYRIFSFSGLLVIAWPLALAIRAADWPALGGVLALSIAISLMTSPLSLRYPAYAFQWYGISICLTMFLGIAVTWWRKDVWTPGVGGFAWSFVALMGMPTTATVLLTLVWKRIYGKPK